MSTGHRLPFDFGKALAVTGGAVLPEVTASSTLALNGRGFSTVDVTATCTVTFPNADPGTQVLVTCDDTSTVTLADAGGTFHVFTGTSGTTAVLCVATDSNSWAATRLVQNSVNSMVTAENVSVADAGSLTTATNLEVVSQEALARTKPRSNTTYNNTDATGTLTAAAIVGGVITLTGETAAYTDTTDTSAAIISALGGAATHPDGASWYLTIKNTVAYTCTIAAGAGVTVTGMSKIPPNSIGHFLVHSDGTTDVTITGLYATPQCVLPTSKFTTITEAANITAAADTLTGAQLCVYTTTGSVAGTALTTRTAAEMYADTPNAHIGFKWLVRLISDGANTTTLTAGDGVTITGTAAAATNTWQEFQATFTTASAVTFQNVGSGTCTATA